MNSAKSLKTTTGIFLFFLFVNAFNNIDELYIPLKQSISTQKVPEIWIYCSELVAFIIFGIALIKAVRNIGNQKFFIKQNVNCFRVMAVSLLLPSVVQLLGNIFDNAHDWHRLVNNALWIAAAVFMAIIANIFHYGMKLKEEQELTI